MFTTKRRLSLRVSLLIVIMVFGLLTFKFPEYAVAATYDATGTWTISYTNNWVNPGTAECDNQPNYSDTIILTQTGDNVMAVDNSDGTSSSGTVSDANYKFSSSFTIDDGNATVMINVYASSSTHASGTRTWDWTDGTYSCNGGSDVSLTKHGEGGVVGLPPDYDATGTWELSFTDNWVDSGNTSCDPDTNRTDIVDIIQNGSSVTIYDNFDEMIYAGGVYGGVYLPYDSYPDDSGTSTEVLNFSLSSSTAGSGIRTWSWTDGTEYCNGEANVSLVKQVVQQFHQYDTNQDWLIGDFELLNAIDAWAVGSLDDFGLLDLIDFWAAGCYQWDALSGSHIAGCL